MDDTKPVVSSEFGESNETPTTKRAAARAESPATAKPGDSTWPARPAKAKVPPWLIAVYVLTGAVALVLFFFFQAEDGIRDVAVTGVQTCALPISCWNERGQGLGLGGPPASRR